jgi:hypothetical protein
MLIFHLGVLIAAAKLGVKKKYINQMKEWDGEEEFTDEDETASPKDETANPKNETVNPKNETSNLKDQTTEPDDAIKAIYKLVGLYLELLLMDDADLKGLAAHASMNEKIKAQNRKDGVTPADKMDDRPWRFA